MILTEVHLLYEIAFKQQITELITKLVEELIDLLFT